MSILVGGVRISPLAGALLTAGLSGIGALTARNDRYDGYWHDVPGSHEAFKTRQRQRTVKGMIAGAMLGAGFAAGAVVGPMGVALAGLGTALVTGVVGSENILP